MINKSKAIHSAVLYHVDISKRYFLVCHLKIVFYFWHELNKGVVTSLNSIIKWPVDSDVTEGVITTRSNRMKFRMGQSDLRLVHGLVLMLELMSTLFSLVKATT